MRGAGKEVEGVDRGSLEANFRPEFWEAEPYPVKMKRRGACTDGELQPNSCHLVRALGQKPLPGAPWGLQGLSGLGRRPLEAPKCLLKDCQGVRKLEKSSRDSRSEGHPFSGDSGPK